MGQLAVNSGKEQNRILYTNRIFPAERQIDPIAINIEKVQSSSKMCS